MYKVKDYKFETEEEAKEASSEMRAVEYLRTKIDMDAPEAALAIYSEVISQDIFHTIVGYDFLKGLQNFLRTSSAIDNASIPNIPDALAQAALPKIDTPPRKEVVEEAAVATAEEELSADEASDEDAPNEVAPTSDTAGQTKTASVKKKPPRPKKAKKKGQASKEETPEEVLFLRHRYQTLTQVFATTTAVLFLAVIAMFIITLTSNHPTILNYENKLIDKYSAWDEELDEREQAVKKREQEVEYRERALKGQSFAEDASSHASASEDATDDGASDGE